jgi:hypothetical protein
MLAEIIEKYWSDILKENIWDWLGVLQPNWSQMKKRGISKKYMDNIKKNLLLDNNISDNDMATELIRRYYSSMAN